MARRVYLGLGSNLGDRWSYLADAVEALAGIDPGCDVSPVYETTPVGGPPGQGPYLNCVVALDTDLEPRALLAVCQGLEEAAGRVRAERFGPRTLDVDVLLIEGYESDDPLLTVPHPRLYGRAFVLAPLFDLAPELAGAPQEWAAAGVVKVGAILSHRPVPGEGEDSAPPAPQ